MVRSMEVAVACTVSVFVLMTLLWLWLQEEDRIRSWRSGFPACVQWPNPEYGEGQGPVNHTPPRDLVLMPGPSLEGMSDSSFFQ